MVKKKFGSAEKAEQIDKLSNELCSSRLLRTSGLSKRKA